MVRAGRVVKIGFARRDNLRRRLREIYVALKDYGTPELVGYVPGTMADEEHALKIGKRVKGAMFAKELFHLDSVPAIGEIFPERQCITSLPASDESMELTPKEIAKLKELGCEAIEWAKDITIQTEYVNPHYVMNKHKKPEEAALVKLHRAETKNAYASSAAVAA